MDSDTIFVLGWSMEMQFYVISSILNSHIGYLLISQSTGSDFVQFIIVAIILKIFNFQLIYYKFDSISFQNLAKLQ